MALYACLLLTQVLAAQSSLQGLADLFARDGLEVGGGEDVINEGGVALLVVGRHCDGGKSRILLAMSHDRVAIVIISPSLVIVVTGKGKAPMPGCIESDRTTRHWVARVG